MVVVCELDVPEAGPQGSQFAAMKTSCAACRTEATSGNQRCRSASGCRDVRPGREPEQLDYPPRLNVWASALSSTR
jgi:hypothetical protein